MSAKQLKELLLSGSEVYFSYERNSLKGGINIWVYEGEIILTWEEFEREDYFNEDNYTKDLREVFGSFEELTAYLSNNRLNSEDFKIP